MPKLIFITTLEASSIANVSTQTIRNLCANKTLRYKKHGVSYCVCRADVLKYKKEIESVYTTQRDIKKNQELLLKENQELSDIRANVREMIVRMGFTPVRMKALSEFLDAEFRLYSESNPSITPRMAEIMMNYLKGDSMDIIANEFGLTRERVRQIWQKGLRLYARTTDIVSAKNKEIETLNKSIEILKNEIAKLNNIIYKNEHPDVVPNRDILTTAQLLITPIKDLSEKFSVRALNVMRALDIKTVLDLVKQDRTIILRCRNCGKKSLLEMDEFLASHDLEWNMDVRPYLSYKQVYDEESNRDKQ